MQLIQRISRNQLQIGSLEDKISTDNPVRFINAFVSFIDLRKVGFEPKNNRRNAKKPFTALQKKKDHKSSEYALK